MAYIQTFEIGTSYGARVNVESLTTLPNMGPHSLFFPFGESVVTGSRARATRGAPYAIWDWGFVPVAMFNAFRVICPLGSAVVNIRTLQQDYSTYAYYDCLMIWPDLDSYEYKAQKYQTFSLRFDNLVLYTP